MAWSWNFIFEFDLYYCKHCNCYMLYVWIRPKDSHSWDKGHYSFRIPWMQLTKDQKKIFMDIMHLEEDMFFADLLTLSHKDD